MEKNGAIGILCLLVPMFLLLTLSSQQVGAVSIFIAEGTGCKGRGLAFFNIPKLTCAPAVGQSVLVLNSSNCRVGGVFQGGDCRNQTFGTLGNFCYSNSQSNVTGAAWEDRCSSRRRHLLVENSLDEKLKVCDTQIEPTGVSFTEDFSKGTWVLESFHAHEHFAHLGNIPFGERAVWLAAKGAQLIPTSSVNKMEM